jgi:hypothetical protein
LRSLTFKDRPDDGEGKSLTTWSTIFRPLCDKAKEANARTPVGGGRAGDGEGQGLINFAMAVKTPGRVAFNSLDLSKHMNNGDEEGEDEMEDGSIGLGSAKRDSRFMHLRTSLALVKGELGTRSAEAHYATVHGGLKGAYAALMAFKGKLAGKASTAHKRLLRQEH